MQTDERRSGDRIQDQFRSSLDLAMGVLYIIVAAYAAATPMIQERFGKQTVYLLGALFAAYGLFRVYRGFVAIRRQMNPGRRRRPRL
ncbi:MAG: hypothetical protein JNJ58_11185 [Chitinophagaceae bacterium]|nr:hypothetical protein [Chitinophagaceae bacterium]